MNPYNNSLYKADVIEAVNNTGSIGKLTGKRVIITGATGLIGSFITDMLIYLNEEKDAGITIIATGRSIQRLNERFEGVNDDRLILTEYDVNKPIIFDYQADYIIHAASNAYPAAFSKYPVDTILSNVMGTYNLLEYGRNHSVTRLLYVSSGEVYGQMPGDIPDFKEEMSGYVDTMKARSCYPSGKRAAETLCTSYTEQYNIDTVVVRPCHCYGANVTANDNRATAQFMNDVINGNDIVLKSTGKLLRSYMYVADCSSAILTVLLKGKSKEAYNIANSNSRVTIAEFAEIVAELAGKKVVYDIPDDGTGGITTPITRQILNSDKLDKLGYKPLYNAREGIAHTMNILKGIGQEK